MYTTATKLVIAIVLAGAVSASAQARSKKFACPMDDKRACMSLQQVYDATNNGARVGADGQPAAPSAAPSVPARSPRTIEAVAGAPVAVPYRCCEATSTAVTVKGDTLAVATPVMTSQVTSQANTSRPEMVLRANRDEPYRTPAQVMRIYVASWEDDAGDLHMGGYLFSELEPRKWTVGVRPPTGEHGFRLLTVSQPSRDAAQEAKSGQGDATAPSSRAE